MKNLKESHIDILAELIAFEGKIEQLSAVMRSRCLKSNTIDSELYFEQLLKLIYQHKNNIEDIKSKQNKNHNIFSIPENNFV
jgi:hypothetical protein